MWLIQKSFFVSLGLNIVSGVEAEHSGVRRLKAGKHGKIYPGLFHISVPA
jgi:hypothetical protein